MVLVAVTVIFLVSCGNDTGDSGNTGDTGNTGDDTGDTGTDDTGDTGTDDDTADTGNTGDDDTADTGDTAVECIGISFENLALSTQYTGYEGAPADQIGDPSGQDFISIQFYKEDYSEITELVPGTYNLAEGLNANYGTCLECVLIYEDFDGEAKTYFQQSGTLTISEIKAGTIESKGTISAKLIEVTINSEDYSSTPVEGGGCYEIEAGAWDNICVPDCTGKICGTDGCGGTCGDGCDAEKTCNAEGTECVDYSCTAITIGTAESVDVMESENYWSYSAGYEPSTGEESADEILVQIFAAPSAEDSFDLAGTNYSDSDQRILALEDPVYDTGGNLTGLGKMYFQQKGTISFESFDPATGKTKANISNLRLIEVTIEQGTYISTPVDGGTCLEIAAGTIDIQ
ncbi:MAG TPA: hypothetical protein P5044_05850 [bacterium]|nr:hypothetical protein [bacterium]